MLKLSNGASRHCEAIAAAAGASPRFRHKGLTNRKPSPFCALNHTSWALSRAGEPQSLGISPRFYPRGANAFARCASPISPALWQEPAAQQPLPTQRDPQRPGRGAPVSLPSLFTGAPGGAGPAGPALSGRGPGAAPITPARLRRPAPPSACASCPLLTALIQLWDRGAGTPGARG